MTTQTSEAPVNVARRDFLKTGGALVVTFSLERGQRECSSRDARAREDGRRSIRSTASSRSTPRAA